MVLSIRRYVSKILLMVYKCDFYSFDIYAAFPFVFQTVAGEIFKFCISLYHCLSFIAADSA